MEKPTLRGWLFFAYYRVFARVPAGSCGLRREAFLPATGRFYSPFAPSGPFQIDQRPAKPMGCPSARLIRVGIALPERQSGFKKEAAGTMQCRHQRQASLKLGFSKAGSDRAL
jgi:hypothetical protein